MAFEQHSDNLGRSFVWKLLKSNKLLEGEKVCLKLQKLPSNLWKALTEIEPIFTLVIETRQKNRADES